MESIYVTKKLEDLNYEPLMNGINTIVGVWQRDIRYGEGFVYYFFEVQTKKEVSNKKQKEKKGKTTQYSDYNIKLRIFNDGFIQASCNCPDYYFRRKKEKDFCKHIYAVIDDINQKKSG